MSYTSGGKITGAMLRKRALDAYEKNPNYCKHCKDKIEVKARKVANVRKMSFCSHRCAASTNNVIFRKRSPQLRKCANCDDEYTGPNKYCGKRCYTEVRTVSTLPGLKKGDLFARNANYQSARSQIRLHAEKVFLRIAGECPFCPVCGYSRHLEVAHIRAVSDFEDGATLSQINSPENLVGMCRNHHWEYDHGELIYVDGKFLPFCGEIGVSAVS